MTRAYLSELLKLRRPSTTVAVVVLGLLGALGTTLMIALADDGPPRFDEGGFVRSLRQFEGSDGAVLGFSQGMGLIGLVVFMAFTIAMTSEFGQGTIRTLLLREPRRLAWLGGKFAALSTVLVIGLLFALSLNLVAAMTVGQIQGVDMTAWWTGDGIVEAAVAFGNALLACLLFGVAGTVLGLLVRSTPLALGIGLAWMFPFEHIIESAWSDAVQVFPGLVFAVIGTGGGLLGADYGAGVLVGLLYAALFAAVGLVTWVRRDVTS